jgi:hypothetical protein
MLLGGGAFVGIKEFKVSSQAHVLKVRSSAAILGGARNFRR